MRRGFRDESRTTVGSASPARVAIIPAHAQHAPRRHGGVEHIGETAREGLGLDLVRGVLRIGTRAAAVGDALLHAPRPVGHQVAGTRRAARMVECLHELPGRRSTGGKQTRAGRVGDQDQGFG